MLDEALQRFPGQIESVEIGVTVLELGYDAQRMRVVIEAAELCRGCSECLLAGMPERRMT